MELNSQYCKVKVSSCTHNQRLYNKLTLTFEINDSHPALDLIEEHYPHKSAEACAAIDRENQRAAARMARMEGRYVKEPSPAPPPSTDMLSATVLGEERHIVKLWASPDGTRENGAEPTLKLDGAEMASGSGSAKLSIKEDKVVLVFSLLYPAAELLGSDLSQVHGNSAYLDMEPMQLSLEDHRKRSAADEAISKFKDTLRRTGTSMTLEVDGATFTMGGGDEVEAPR